MASNFPTGPTLNQTHSADGKTWKWTGVAWGLSALTAGTTDTTVLNNIANQFDGAKTVFDLRLEQSSITTLVDSKDLEVVIGGQKLTPYVDIVPFPWLSPYDSFNGFRVRNAQVTIYNAPYAGDAALLTYTKPSTSRQKLRYPFSAATIAFGD